MRRGCPRSSRRSLGLPGVARCSTSIVAVVRVGGVGCRSPPSRSRPSVAPVAALVAGGRASSRRRRRIRAAARRAGARPRAGRTRGRRPARRRRPRAARPAGPRAAPAGRRRVGGARSSWRSRRSALGDVAGRATRLVVLDVGQGDAILVESRTGARMLVDGGPDPDRLLVELDARIPPWDRRHRRRRAHATRTRTTSRGWSASSSGTAVGPRVRARDARTRARLAGVGRGAPRRRPPRGTLATGARLRLDEVALTVAVAGPGRPVEPAATGPRDQRHLDRAARRGQRAAVPAHGRCRGGRGPGAARPRPAARRRAQGRPPRQRDGDQRRRSLDAVRPRARADLRRAPATTTATRRRATAASGSRGGPAPRVRRTRPATGTIEVRRCGARRRSARSGPRRTASPRTAAGRAAVRRAAAAPGRSHWLHDRSSHDHPRAAARPPACCARSTRPRGSLRHACAVADVAAWLARARRRRAGTAVDAAAVEAAALLHDVDKLPAGRVRRHSATATARRPGSRHTGCAELGAAGPRPPGDAARRRRRRARGSRPAPLEARIVAYADKRAGQRLESMDERFASWRRRYPSGPATRSGRRPGAERQARWDDATSRSSWRAPRRSSARSARPAGVAPGRGAPPALVAPRAPRRPAA